MARLLLTSGGTVPLDGPRARHLDPVRRIRSTAEYQRLRALVMDEEPACRWCGSEVDPHMDHIVPMSRAPELALERTNVRRLCGDCNTRRGVADSLSAAAAPHPRNLLAMRTGLGT